MSHTDTLNAAIARIRKAARDCPPEAWHWIDNALADIERAYIGRASELLAANNIEAERRRAAEAGAEQQLGSALRDLLAATDTVAARCGLPAELFRPRAAAREALDA